MSLLLFTDCGEITFYFFFSSFIYSGVSFFLFFVWFFDFFFSNISCCICLLGFGIMVIIFCCRIKVKANNFCYFDIIKRLKNVLKLLSVYKKILRIMSCAKSQKVYDINNLALWKLRKKRKVKKIVTWKWTISTGNLLANSKLWMLAISTIDQYMELSY